LPPLPIDPAAAVAAVSAVRQGIETGVGKVIGAIPSLPGQLGLRRDDVDPAVTTDAPDATPAEDPAP
jgi:hypothetical protein